MLTSPIDRCRMDAQNGRSLCIHAIVIVPSLHFRRDALDTTYRAAKRTCEYAILFTERSRRDTPMPHLITNESDMARKATRVWARGVIEATGMSATDWAHRAGVNPSTLSRLLDPVSRQVPSSSTVLKLARVAGSQPNLGTYERVPARTVPLYLYGDAMGSVTGHFLTGHPVSEEAFAVRISTDIMNAAGITPGTVVIFEPTTRMPPANGKIVIAEDVDGEQMLGRMMAPWLMPQSTGKHDPRLLDEMHIVGVAVAYQQTL